MTGPPLDPDALRLRLALDRLEAAAIFDEIEPGDRDLIIRETRAVLALVDDLRKENERLREANAHLWQLLALTRSCVFPINPRGIKLYIAKRIDTALAGSPGVNEE